MREREKSRLSLCLSVMALSQISCVHCVIGLSVMHKVEGGLKGGGMGGGLGGAEWSNKVCEAYLLFFFLHCVARKHSLMSDSLGMA